MKIDDEALNSLGNCSCVALPTAIHGGVSSLTHRNMELQATIQDGEVYLTSDNDNCTAALKER